MTTCDHPTCWRDKRSLGECELAALLHAERQASELLRRRIAELEAEVASLREAEDRMLARHG
jgi:hypothetical protein